MQLDKILKKANKTIDDIETIYYGLDDCCRCGCGGTYYTIEDDEDSFMEQLEYIDSEYFKKMEFEDGYVNLPIANEHNMCYSIYWKN
jgi:hypothetical protein